MAHNINVENGRASIVYARQTPWHRLGQGLTEAFTAETALVQGGLDFVVEKTPICTMDRPGKAIVGQFATRRTDNGNVLGIVGDRYTPLQNKEAFSFFDGLFGAGAKYEVAGALGLGEKVWILANIGDNRPIIKGDDVQKYVLLTNSHDGSDSIRCMFTPIRVVCQNTLNAALSGVKNEIKLRHTVNASNKLRFAGELLGKIGLYYDEIASSFQQLALTQIKEATLREYAETVIIGRPGIDGASTRQKNQVNRIVELHDTGCGNDPSGVRGTLWGAYNAATEWVDHERIKDDLTPLFVGSGVEYKQRAYDVAVDMASAMN